MKAILDTDVLIEERFAQPGYEIAVCTVSLAELSFGAESAHDAVEKARRVRRNQRIRRTFADAVPFDEAAADMYGVVCHLVKAHGRDPRSRTIDLMIAATAAANGAVVITRNVDDFAGLEGFVEVVQG